MVLMMLSMSFEGGRNQLGKQIQRTPKRNSQCGNARDMAPFAKGQLSDERNTNRGEQRSARNQP
jgi:hypothetical protein